MARNTRSTGRVPMLRESVEQVWLAGLGALALTEEEGMRFFRRLVKKGEGLEKQTRTRLNKAMDRAREVPSATMERMESRLDDTRMEALHRLGVPTSREIESLKRRVEGLADTLEQRGSTTRRSTTTRKTAASKTAASRTATSKGRAGSRTATRTAKGAGKRTTARAKAPAASDGTSHAS